MKRDFCRKRQLDNKGMSLIEIILAMLLLSIVVVPTLQILVTTTKYNAKAKQKQMTMNTAEAVMEMCKAYDIETLCEKYVASPSESGLKGATTTATGYRTGLTGDVEENPVFGSGEFIPSPLGEYLLQAGGVQTDYGIYDVEVKIKKKELPGGTDAEQDVLNIASLNEYTDAIFMGSYYWDEQAKQAILQEIADAANADADAIRHDYTTDDFTFYEKWIAQRVMILDFHQEGTRITGTFEMYYYYLIEPEDAPEYDVTGGGKKKYTRGGSPGFYYIPMIDKNGVETTCYQFYDNVGTDAKLENVYLYYYPNYYTYTDESGTKVAATQDVCRIYSDLESDPDYHVYKQRTPYAKPLPAADIDLQLNEQRYRNIIFHYFELKSGKTDKPHIYHNMNVNLHDMSYKNSPANPVLAYTITDRGSLNKEEINAVYSDGIINSEPFDNKLITRKPLLYSVEVTVYDAADTGHTKPITRILGTMNE